MNTGKCYSQIQNKWEYRKQRIEIICLEGIGKSFVEEVTCEVCPGRGGVVSKWSSGLRFELSNRSHLRALLHFLLFSLAFQCTLPSTHQLMFCFLGSSQAKYFTYKRYLPLIKILISAQTVLVKKEFSFSLFLQNLFQPSQQSTVPVAFILEHKNSLTMQKQMFKMVFIKMRSHL